MGKKLKITQKKEKQKTTTYARTNSLVNYDLSNFQKKITKEIELNDQKIKNQITENIKNKKNSPINLDINKILESDDFEEKGYSKKYSYYLKEEFNSKIILMTLKYINESKIFQNDQKNDFDFIFEFINIIKNLLFNEFELSVLALYLDEIGWTTWQHFYFISLTIKKKLNPEKYYLLLINILEKYNKDFKNSFELWSNNFSKNFSKLENIEITEINKKFLELSKQIYDFNKKKFIDYNYLVNKILSNAKSNKDKVQNDKEEKEKVEVINKNQINANQNNLSLLNNNLGSFLNMSRQNSLGLQPRLSSNLLLRSQGSFNDNNFSSLCPPSMLDLRQNSSFRSFHNMSGNLDLSLRNFSSSSFHF